MKKLKLLLTRHYLSQRMFKANDVDCFHAGSQHQSFGPVYLPPVPFKNPNRIHEVAGLFIGDRNLPTWKEIVKAALSEILENRKI